MSNTTHNAALRDRWVELMRRLERENPEADADQLKFLFMCLLEEEGLAEKFLEYVQLKLREEGRWNE